MEKSQKPSVMPVLCKISKALDSGDIGQVHVALQALDDTYDTCDLSLKSFLQELVTWDLAVDPDTSSKVISRLFDLLENQETVKEHCTKILLLQPTVAVQIAVELMILNNWIPSPAECNEAWKKCEKQLIPENLTARKGKEYATRVAANCRIFRVAGSPNSFLNKFLTKRLKPICGLSKIPLKFLMEFSFCNPFHPLIVQHNEDLDYCLIPCVYTDLYATEQEIEQFSIFLQPNGGFQAENARGMLKVFHQLCRSSCYMLKASDIGRIVDFWMAGMRIFEGNGFSIEDIKATGQWLERITSCFEMAHRPLFLKHFLRKLNEKKDSCINMEPQIVGLVISIFQRNAFKYTSSEFYEELGDFWTLVNQMKYDDVYGSTAYFSSVFALARAQALFRVKKALCRQVYEKILKPMYEQIVDFTKLKSVEDEKAVTDAQKMMVQQGRIGEETFSILVCTYKQAEESILKFINE